MKVPAEFAAQIEHRVGPEAVSWVQELPATAERLFAEWELGAVGQPTHGDLGLIVPVRTRSATAVVKFTYPDAMFRAEARWLQSHAEHPSVVDIYDVDLDSGALLLEHLTGPNLWAVPAEEAARIIGELHRSTVLPADQSYPDLADRYRPGALAESNRELGQPFSAEIVDRADMTAGYLLGSRDAAVVNEDLYSSHVRTSATRSWKLSDPKPVIGEAAYGLFPFLVDRWDTSSIEPGQVVSAAAGDLDEPRVYGWILVHAVEFGLWAQRSGFFGDANRARRVASWAISSF